MFNKFIKIFKKFIKDAFDVTSKIVIGKYKEFAIEVVKDLSLQVLTNEEKRKKAFESIKEKAKKEGEELKESLINTLIELAVQYVKNNK